MKEKRKKKSKPTRKQGRRQKTFPDEGRNKRVKKRK
jgi:hypothetical protein